MLGLVLLLVVAAPPPPVILITVDGVRREEVFRGLDAARAGAPAAEGAPLLAGLHALAAREGFLAGDAEGGDPFPVLGASALSLPGYQSLLAGRDLPCQDNRCGRIGVETVLERVRRELGLTQAEVAVVGGWPEVALAAERTPGRLAVSVGFAPLTLDGEPLDADGAALAGDPAAPPPWGYRRDSDTWALAMHHLVRHRPRLLWIALGDPDEWAHLDDYPAYAAAVRDLDGRLQDLLATLAAMGEFGEGASVLVTTDHGRGDGEAWSAHGAVVEGSRLAWLFASTPATRVAPGGAGRGRYDHASIRPTIEALLGLPPCAECQAPIAELLPEAWAAQAGAPLAGAGGP